MTSTTYDIIGLEDFEQKKGLCEFSINNLSHVKMETEEIKIKKKSNTQRIIVRDGRYNPKDRKTKELF
jgi:hypothetical protein